MIQSKSTHKYDRVPEWFAGFCDPLYSAAPFVKNGWIVAASAQVVARIAARLVATPPSPDQSESPIASLALMVFDPVDAVAWGEPIPLPADGPPGRLTCPKCEGKPNEPRVIECDECEGAGVCRHCGQICRQCDGKRSITVAECDRCNGVGTLPNEANVVIRPRSIVEPGLKLRADVLAAILSSGATSVQPRIDPPSRWWRDWIDAPVRFTALDNDVDGRAAVVSD